jgi:enamine deaminase RidA (YjgF/YER057c/UK114 family)
MDTPSITFLQPAGLHTPPTYSHVAIARGGTTIHISGQLAHDAQGNLVGAGDLRAQTRQVYQNLGKALAAAGATFDDVVKQTTYVVDYKPEHRMLIGEVRFEFLARERPPASTLIGVAALAQPGFLIEIEVVAVI